MTVNLIPETTAESLYEQDRLLAQAEDSARARAMRIFSEPVAPEAEPEPQTWTFRDGFRQQPEIDQVHRKTNKFKHMTLYDVVGADKPEGAYGPIHAFKEGVDALAEHLGRHRDDRHRCQRDKR